MPRGRPPTPKVLNDLKGDPGRRRRYQREPEPPSGAPKCPDYLDAIAQQEWVEVCQHLADMRLLSRADKTALELYCVAYSRYRKAQENVAKYGSVIFAGKDKYPMKSPWACEQDKQHDLLKGMLTEFCLTPAARARARVDISEKPSGGITSYLNVA